LPTSPAPTVPHTARHFSYWHRALVLAAAIVHVCLGAMADPLVEPRVFASAGGVLDLLMVARAQPAPTISFQPPDGSAPLHPVGWMYEVCPRPSIGYDCPPNAMTASDYGGVRLSLRPGDVLRIRLVNRLPALDPAKVKHGREPGQANLFRNPTNLHTHGLIVPPRRATVGDPTFGDYVFLQVFNSANGMPVPQGTHQHGPIKMDVADYRIEIPADHPPGLYWFHPHIHGLSLNQVSSGMAGIITIGDVGDYVIGAPRTVRHLVLKDMQVLAAGTLQYDSGPVTVQNGEVQNQQIADFCDQRDSSGPEGRHGYCEGAPAENGSGNSFIGSRWYFTVNGQVFPTIRVTAPDGELWRITNASGQVSYRLRLIDDATKQPMLMQLVAIDGVSISVPGGTPAGAVTALGGNRFTAVDCPPNAANRVCVSDLVMMPASRAEVWITYRNPHGTVTAPPAHATATLTQGERGDVFLGPAAEAWPEVKLASVEFTESITTQAGVGVLASRMGTPFIAAARPPPAVPPGTMLCRPLAAGHHRRVFFGVENPTDPNSNFGLGYEEVDQGGAVVAGTQVPVRAFDPTQTLICLPLGPGGTPVHERWELINLSRETHNFHMHQTKFTVLDAAALTRATPTGSTPAGIVEDTVPVPFATTDIAAIDDVQNGYCTIDQWRGGVCKVTPVLLDIPFSQLGEFVFHCHILEHEDGGMMAKIRVVSASPSR
jgi:L-ascorbate oxidase